MDWKLPRRTLTFDRPLVMGIVNVTPDSFSDGGEFFDASHAVDHAVQLVADGADILDIGGESTRPYATPVSESEELRRVSEVLRLLAPQISVPISIDTMKVRVAQAAIDLGAEIVNDVSGLRDAAMVECVRKTGAAAIVMHMKGTPQSMQDDPQYDDVVIEVKDYLGQRLKSLTASGIAKERIAIDPGIGFGKKSVHNWQILARLSDFQDLGCPLCLGVSRKGFLGKEREPKDRMIAGLAAACHGIATGVVQMIRTHDVKSTRDAVDALAMIAEANR